MTPSKEKKLGARKSKTVMMASQELALTAPIQSQAQSKFAPAAALAADETVLNNYVS